MTKDITNSLFGQRLSSKQLLQLSLHHGFAADWLLPQLLVNRESLPKELALELENWLRIGSSTHITPVLEVDFVSIGEGLMEKISQIAEVLKGCNLTKVVLAVDEDNQAISLLSPRNKDENLRSILRQQILDCVSLLSQEFECWVALTVEELCPGGLDPALGIKLAQEFVNCGAAGIIASGGTRDFPPLKFRRETKRKDTLELETSDWPETWLSSAQSLKEASTTFEPG